MSGERSTDTLSCDTVRERLALHFYGAAEEAEALQRHLEACRSCAVIWGDTLRHLRSVDAAAMFPGERQVDWAAFARHTAARARAAAEAGGRTGAARLPGTARNLRWLAWGGLLAAAAAVAVIAGLRLMPPPRLPPVAAARQPGALHEESEGTRFLQESVTRRAAARSLRDGRALLVDLMQVPARCRRSDGSYDVALEKARANDLVRRMNLYQGSLGGPGDRRLADLMGQLEGLLLQVSALDDCTAGQALHDLRQAIDRRQLLLRIDLVTREVEEGGSRA